MGHKVVTDDVVWVDNVLVRALGVLEGNGDLVKTEDFDAEEVVHGKVAMEDGTQELCIVLAHRTLCGGLLFTLMA